MATVWETVTPYHLLGLKAQAPQRAQSDLTPGIARSSGPGVVEAAHPLSPDSPLFWFGLVLLVTVGAVAFSTSIRVGPARGSIGLGRT